MKVEVAVLGSRPQQAYGFCGLQFLWTTVSVYVKQHFNQPTNLPIEVLVSAELRSCVKVEVDVLASQSLTVRTVSVDVKQPWNLLTSKFRSCVKEEVDVLGS